MNVLDKLSKDVARITPYEPGKPIDDVARELGLDPATIIKLAANENPLGPSPKAIEAIQATAANNYQEAATALASAGENEEAVEVIQEGAEAAGDLVESSDDEARDQ